MNFDLAAAAATAAAAAAAATVGVRCWLQMATL